MSPTQSAKLSNYTLLTVPSCIAVQILHLALPCVCVCVIVFMFIGCEQFVPPPGSALKRLPPLSASDLNLLQTQHLS